MKVHNQINARINYNPQFKGTVSPEFIKYVDVIRNDCLATVSGKNHNLINNICDGLIERSKNVMEKCFHPNSVLTIESLPEESCDMLLVKNDIINKHIGTAYDQGFLCKRGKLKPIKRLRELQDWIKGMNMLFYEASGKILFSIQGSMLDGCTSCKGYEYSPEAVQEVVDVLKWERGKLNQIPSLAPNIPAENVMMSEEFREEIIENLEKRIMDLNEYNQKQHIKQSK